jgi:hypothetical protein
MRATRLGRPSLQRWRRSCPCEAGFSDICISARLWCCILPLGLVFLPMQVPSALCNVANSTAVLYYLSSCDLLAPAALLLGQICLVTAKATLGRITQTISQSCLGLAEPRTARSRRLSRVLTHDSATCRSQCPSHLARAAELRRPGFSHLKICTRIGRDRASGCDTPAMKTFRNRPPIWRRDINVSFKGKDGLLATVEDAESSAAAAQASAPPNLKRKSAGEPLSVGAPPDLKKRSFDPTEALSALSLFTVDDACMVLILRCGGVFKISKHGRRCAAKCRMIPLYVQHMPNCKQILADCCLFVSDFARSKLDTASIAAASCSCKRWRRLAGKERLWEALCHRDLDLTHPRDADLQPATYRWSHCSAFMKLQVASLHLCAPDLHILRLSAGSCGVQGQLHLVAAALWALRQARGADSGRVVGSGGLDGAAPARRACDPQVGALQALTHVPQSRGNQK